MKKTGILIWACATHFLVDFICALVITHQIPGTRNWDLLLLAYNFLAFAGQLPLGVLLDLICKKSGKWGYLPAALLGCILCAGALIAGLSPWLLVLSAGLGNALFHLGSGADILRDSRGKSRESGLFVSTGAAVFLAFSHIPIMGFLGVLLFNMTMPITLTGLFRRIPENPGLSFGLLTFALYLGYLPVYAGMAENLSRPAVYVFLTLLSLGLMTVSEKGEKSNGC